MVEKKSEKSKAGKSPVEVAASQKSTRSEQQQKSVVRSAYVQPQNTPDIQTEEEKFAIRTEDKRLSVDPEEGQFLEGGGRQDFMLVNTTDSPIAVKIKCSNNAQYRVMPVYLKIDTNQISTLSVTRLPGPAKNDKLVAAYCPILDGVKDPKDAITKFEAKGKKCQIIRIMLKVVNAEDFAVPDPSREAVS